MKDNVLWLFFAACVAAAILLGTGVASANAGGNSRYDRARLLGLVARTSMNEALDSVDDLDLLWGIVRGHGDTARERYVWLAAHSPCVSRRLSQDEAYRRPGNCRWTRNLHPDGRRPRGWDRERDGAWSRLRPRWLAHIERVRERVIEGYVRILCPEPAMSWDGARWRDEIVERGFRVLECKGDLRNLGVVPRVARASLRR